MAGENSRGQLRLQGEPAAGIVAVEKLRRLKEPGHIVAIADDRARDAPQLPPLDQLAADAVRRGRPLRGVIQAEDAVSDPVRAVERRPQPLRGAADKGVL